MRGLVVIGSMGLAAMLAAMTLNAHAVPVTSGVATNAAASPHKASPVKLQAFNLPTVNVPTTFTWEKAGFDKHSVTFLDTKNITFKGHEASFWSRVDHNSPLNLGIYKNIASEYRLSQVDCGTGKSTMFYWEGRDPKGKIVDTQVMHADYTEPAPAGSIAGVLFSKVCRSAPKGG